MFFVYVCGFLICLLILQDTGQVKASNEIPSRKLPNFPTNIPITTINYENWANELKVENLWSATPLIADDVVTLANWAYINGYKLRASGFMHNWSPLTVTKVSDSENVVLVDTTKNLISMSITSSPNLSVKTVTVQTGASMFNLLSFLEQHDFGLFATPAVGDITVGGALTIGGHGAGVGAVGETVTPGHAYGTLSNLVVSLTAVVWNPISKKYVLKLFERSDADAKAFLIHLGRSFITEVKLMIGVNYNLRCVSRIDISNDELFADPANVTSSTRTFASFLDKAGRVETISFPYADKTWLKVWTISPEKPLFSRKVLHPYNYPFCDNIIDTVAHLYSKISNGLSYLNPTLSKAQFLLAKGGLLTTYSFDIWGPSKNLLLYLKPTTLRVTTNGYAIITERRNIQKVVSTVISYQKVLLNYYAKIGKFPFSGQLEIRATLLDQPGVVPKGDSPAFSVLHPINNRPEFDVAVWIDIFGVPNAEYFNAMSKFESFLYNTFNGTDAILRPEWSKGWAYTYTSAWSNETVYRDFIPATFRSTNDKDGWNWAVSTLDKYDPNRIFSNDFLDKLVVPAKPLFINKRRKHFTKSSNIPLS